MNLQPGIQTRPPANGFNRRRFDREGGTRSDNKMQPGKTGSNNFACTVNGGKTVPVSSSSRDRLIYVSSCLIGLYVEVHVKNGSVLSGIFCTVNAKDFGIVLKMAQIIKDGSIRGQKSIPETPKRPQTIIIPAREFVQIIAKVVPLTSDEFATAHLHERRKDLMIDSVISRSHNVEVERDLERWTPDADDLECPELENIFDGAWNRNWDQFEINKTLFGVKSTFNEELYTTKLERGPQMKDLEREASRIAREIEGEETLDLHLAEERGMHFHEGFDIDEESRYSAVHRRFDDGRVDENEDFPLDSCNTETFGSSINSNMPRLHSNISRDEKFDEHHASSTHSSVDEEALSRYPSDTDGNNSGTYKQSRSSASDDTKKCLSAENGSTHMLKFICCPPYAHKPIQDQNENKSFLIELTDKVSVESHISTREEEIFFVDKKGPSSPAIVHDPPSFDSENKDNRSQSPELAYSRKMPVCSLPVDRFPIISIPFTSEHIVTDSVSRGHCLSPSSSIGSLSSEKLSLNPNAKEFKLNPNAKCFTPSSSFRPSMPMSEVSSFYYTTTVPAVSPMPGLPEGVGIGPSFGAHQPAYNPQAPQLQSPQHYVHANGPLYGPQMIIGQPQTFYYMPTYPPDMPYRGRNF